jgi:hypothetical protein
MKRCWLAISMLILLSSQSFAATWTDPNFEQLVKLSPFIVQIEAIGVGSKQHIHQFRIVKIYHGKKSTKIISVTGFFDPERRSAPKIPKQSRFIAFLNQKGSLWRPATPSYGLFPVKGDQVLGSVRDTSMRMAVSLVQYEAFLTAVVPFIKTKKSPSSWWLKEQRQSIDNGALIALDKKAATKLHFALEALYYFAKAKDLPRLRRLLRSDLFQIRASSVRGISAIKNDLSALMLFDKACQDSSDTVKNWAALGLARFKRLPKVCISKLIENYQKLGREEVRLHRSVEDPRRNALPAAQTSVLALLGRLKEKPALPLLLSALEGSDEERLKAALDGILRFGEEALTRKIIDRMRSDNAPDRHCNQYFAAALQRATGQKLGQSKQAWLHWWNKKKAPVDGNNGKKQKRHRPKIRNDQGG